MVYLYRVIFKLVLLTDLMGEKLKKSPNEWIDILVWRVIRVGVGIGEQFVTR